MELRSGKVCLGRTSGEDPYKEHKGQILWKMVTKFGEGGVLGVATNESGDVAVAGFWAARINVYSIDDGKMKMSIDTSSSRYKSYPHGVAVWQDKYLVCDQGYFPTVYDSCGNYVRQLSTPPNCSAHPKYGICISPQGNVTFSSYHSYSWGNNTKHVCFSNINDDKDASSIIAPIPAQYIATSSDENKIVISANGPEGAQVINKKGETIHILSPPTLVTSSWWPSGVCTIGDGEDEEVFVCNRGSPKGVYRFSLTTGEYLSCVTTDVSDPRGIAFTNDGRIVVADDTCVKVFAPSD